MPAATVAYYSTDGYTSPGGQSLAQRLAWAFSATSTLGEATTSGMRLTVLRETRMTAVVCSLGPVNRIADAAGTIGDAVVAALAAWVASPGELTVSSR